MPFLLHEIVTLCVKSFEELGDECVAVAYAVAEFPFLEDDMDLIDQVVAGAVALGEQLMQREVVPSYSQLVADGRLAQLHGVRDILHAKFAVM